MPPSPRCSAPAAQYWLTDPQPWVPQLRPKAKARVTALGAVDIRGWRLFDGEPAVVSAVSPRGDFRLGRPGEERERESPWASAAARFPLLQLADGSLIGATRTPACSIVLPSLDEGEEVRTVSFTCPGGAEVTVSALPGALRVVYNGVQDPQDFAGPVSCLVRGQPSNQCETLALRIRGVPELRYQDVPSDGMLLARIRRLCRSAGVGCQIPDSIELFDPTRPIGDRTSQDEVSLPDGRVLPLRVPTSRFLDVINDWPNLLGTCPPKVQNLVSEWRGCLRCTCKASTTQSHAFGAPTVGAITLCKKLTRMFVQEHFPEWRLPKLYWSGPAEEIELAACDFPADYVAKSTHGAGGYMVVIVRNGRDMGSGDEVTPQWLSRFFRTFDVLVEELVVDADGSCQIPRDFKCFVFGGKLRCIEVVSRERPAGTPQDATVFSTELPWRASFLSASGERFGGVHFRAQAEDSDIVTLSKSACDEFQRLSAEMSTVLGHRWFLRVDWYLTEQGPVFGELTAHPGGGEHYLPSGLRLLDQWAAEMLDGAGAAAPAEQAAEETSACQLRSCGQLCAAQVLKDKSSSSPAPIAAIC
eukprot:TRINITY_DN23969_c0_g1_i1.p1 TRINITY_DN23969_c0_g1~~TRINITY_DN23969_c0_g1_i1.p1  ORF type:complete len:585 (+),score=81.94 TRINITY_DN23969_c0_g1_i1:98-1852(+)